ncbi:IS30 family transposase [Flexivirga oryzae]|uniref:IS30 family transposase n=1 Tax=Flexivirga oryzae TaxID=1794944 RepID=A0A839N757_9MICO|nr:IS30 family transposase [Flexivirga oryzae]MBB2893590.1 IS30 family transposase [Flexivirga oryzae]
MAAKRRRFLELLAQGSSVAAAYREVGVSRSTANVWKNGTVVRRKDGTVKVVPPLEPLVSRTISPRLLSEQERIQIAELASRGLGPAAIAKELGRSPSTISRELRRNLHTSGQYRPFHAHALAAARRRRKHPLKLRTDRLLRAYVIERLRERWSPQQISRALRRAHPDDPSRRVATETIYQAIYRLGSEIARKPAASPLRTGRDHRRGQARQVRARRRFAQPMLSVHERGFDPADRSVAGHWEGDLIVGPHNRSAIGTLVERQTRYVKLLHLNAHNSIELHAAIMKALRELPPTLRRTLTWDQGTEMAKHLDISADTGTKIYFCDAASPWQRGSNENTNELLRQYFPKSTDLAVHTARDLARVEAELNRLPPHRPRRPGPSGPLHGLARPYGVTRSLVRGLRAGASLTRFVGYRVGAACSAYPTIVGGPGVYRAYECRAGCARPICGGGCDRWRHG